MDRGLTTASVWLKDLSGNLRKKVISGKVTNFSNPLTLQKPYAKILNVERIRDENLRSETEWGCGVAANMRPCQGRDRGFEPRHSRLKYGNLIDVLFLFNITKICYI